MAATMILESERLFLRPVARGDAAATAALITPEITARVAAWPSPTSLAQAHFRIAKAVAGTATGAGIDLAILRRDDQQLIGWLSVAVVDADRHLGTVSYWLGAAFHDQGYMTEAAHAALPRLAARLGLKAIEACVQPDNFASQAILERLGFGLKGRRRVFAPGRGVEEEVIVFAVPVARLRLRRSTGSPGRRHAVS